MAKKPKTPDVPFRLIYNNLEFDLKPINRPNEPIKPHPVSFDVTKEKSVELQGPPGEGRMRFTFINIGEFRRWFQTHRATILKLYKESINLTRSNFEILVPLNQELDEIQLEQTEIRLEAVSFRMFIGYPPKKGKDKSSDPRIVHNWRPFTLQIEIQRIGLKKLEKPQKVAKQPATLTISPMGALIFTGNPLPEWIVTFPEMDEIPNEFRVIETEEIEDEDLVTPQSPQILLPNK